AAVALTNEHCVRIYDVGELPEGVPFMIMELLRGSDLDEIIARRGRLPFPEAVDALLQATEAVAEAHARAIVHRDLKPKNLFLVDRAGGASLVKVLDFGLAKMPLQDGETKLTSTAAIMGSPRYMSPEQMRGAHDIDGRTDIWSLGVTLYELL